MTEPHENCIVCGRQLPLPTIEKVRHGGRARIYCGNYCRIRAGRRGRTVKRLRRWAEIATKRGVPQAAAQFTAQADRLEAMPFVKRPSA